MIFVNIVCHSRKNPRCILAQKLLSLVLSGLEKRKLFDSLLRVRMRHQNTSHDYFFSTNNVYVVIQVSDIWIRTLSPLKCGVFVMSLSQMMQGFMTFMKYESLNIKTRMYIIGYVEFRKGLICYILIVFVD